MIGSPTPLASRRGKRAGPQVPTRLGGPPLPAPRPPRLHVTTDHGNPVPLTPPGRRDWGELAEGFLRQNGDALDRLAVQARIEPGPSGTRLLLYPGGRVGAIPLRSPESGHVISGCVVRPRFGWAGMGRVLEQTGWQASPQLLPLPLVPGSGREVPPWVIAGPVIRRLRALLAHAERGYRLQTATLPAVRGRVDWNRYATGALPAGRWDRFPCRYPDLGPDPRLRAEVRWALERLRRGLLSVAGADPLAWRLAEEASALLAAVADVPASRPTLHPPGSRGFDPVVTAGLEALGWVADDRGLGGAADLHGVAWAEALDALWERFVEGAVRRWATTYGGDVRTTRERTATLPLRWDVGGVPSLGHLAPDAVVRIGRQVIVFDAKYKAHLANVDADGWRAFSEDERATHRADVHQVLAYAGLFDADMATAVLVYPLRQETWARVQERGRAVMTADVDAGGRRVRLCLAGLPFGWATPGAEVPIAWHRFAAGGP